MNCEIEKIHETFLGRIVKDVTIVILTPIYHLYTDIYDMLHCDSEEISGFFRNAYFRKEHTFGILICCSQGAAAQDVVLLFPNLRVIFVGYGGSLTDKIPIGTPIEIERAVFNSNESYLLVNPNLFHKAVIAYSPCFLGEIAENALSLATQSGATVIDMETVFCAKAAYDNNCAFSAFLVITDIPNYVDVWILNKTDKDNVNTGIRLMLSYIYDKLL